ncbi:MAG: hypothetical protein H6Q16_286 [Bacteroidetes bacterium]|nr:hypothetical protein [Bacteroidota bacterium]
MNKEIKDYKVIKDISVLKLLNSKTSQQLNLLYFQKASIIIKNISVKNKNMTDIN